MSSRESFDVPLIERSVAVRTAVLLHVLCSIEQREVALSAKRERVKLVGISAGAERDAPAMSDQKKRRTEH